MFVSDDVVHKGGPASARVAQPHGLYWGRSQGEDLVPGSLGVAVHVDEDVDAVGVDLVGRLVVGRDLREVDEVLRPLGYLLPEGRVVVGLETAEGGSLNNIDSLCTG